MSTGAGSHRATSRMRIVAEAIAGLVEAERPFVAADLLAFDERVTKGMVPPELVARLLDAAASVTVGCDTPGPDFASSAGFLLDALKWADYEETALARSGVETHAGAELPRKNPGCTAPALWRRILSSFVEMLSVVFRA